MNILELVDYVDAICERLTEDYIAQMWLCSVEEENTERERE